MTFFVNKRFAHIFSSNYCTHTMSLINFHIDSEPITMMLQIKLFYYIIFTRTIGMERSLQETM